MSLFSAELRMAVRFVRYPGVETTIRSFESTWTTSAVKMLLTYSVQSEMRSLPTPFCTSAKVIGWYNLVAFRRSSLGNEASANEISKSSDFFRSDAARSGSAPNKTATCKDKSGGHIANIWPNRNSPRSYNLSQSMNEGKHLSLACLSQKSFNAHFTFCM